MDQYGEAKEENHLNFVWVNQKAGKNGTHLSSWAMNTEAKANLCECIGDKSPRRLRYDSVLCMLIPIYHSNAEAWRMQ